MAHQHHPTEINIGVVGLGLMGSSIVVALLLSGHRVIGIAPLAEDMEQAPEKFNSQLLHCEKSGLLTYPIAHYLSKLTISTDYSLLRDCELVLECIIEKEHIKEQVYQKITNVVGEDVVIASNTSAIPISTLQNYVRNPQRFMGIHWAEPAYATRFLEITCGEKTAAERAEWAFELAHSWGKEPTLLKKDIRGFITNRLMYAVYREGLSMVENNEASIADIDKAFRYDEGSWMTLMGIFRRMDMMGLKNFFETFKANFPRLSNQDHIPTIMQRIIDIDAKGTQNSKGLYPYQNGEAKEWDRAFSLFNKDISVLADEYAQNRELIKDR
ncbi:MAG: 3-hydroxyacyl-CoA dehydrogenase family protein [Pedobacter sp.]|nr:3-hydroxyacyl-CoA dehydrogenase family protein [Pedobacter sp.]MDQ8051691.1 3-hydroxyacyl-CoA dehydrogenase family protein [Pedobacter sp.]